MVHGYGGLVVADKIDHYMQTFQVSDSGKREAIETDIRVEKMIREMFDAEIKKEAELRAEARGIKKDKHQYIVWYLTLALGAATLFTKVMGWW